MTMCVYVCVCVKSMEDLTAIKQPHACIDLLLNYQKCVDRHLEGQI